MNQDTEALELLLMFRPNAFTQTDFDGDAFQFSISYCEIGAVKFVVAHRSLAKAVEQAEAAAVAYIEKVTGG